MTPPGGIDVVPRRAALCHMGHRPVSRMLVDLNGKGRRRQAGVAGDAHVRIIGTQGLFEQNSKESLRLDRIYQDCEEGNGCIIILLATSRVRDSQIRDQHAC